MTKVKNFSENLEASLDRLGEELKSHKEQKEGGVLNDKEIVKRSLQYIASTPQSLGVTANSQQQKSQDDDYMPLYLKNAEKKEEIQRAVEHLISLTLEKGIEKAVSVAKKANPFVEDAFHDALADKLIPELKKRGLL